MIEHMPAQTVAHLDAHLKLAALRVRFQFLGNANIAFGVGRVLKHLSVLIPIAARGFDLRWILDREEARFGSFQLHLPGSAERDDDVIAFMKWQIAELRAQHTAAFVHPPGLVRLRIPIVIVHALGGPG